MKSDSGPKSVVRASDASKRCRNAVKPSADGCIETNTRGLSRPTTRAVEQNKAKLSGNEPPKFHVEKANARAKKKRLGKERARKKRSAGSKKRGVGRISGCRCVERSHYIHLQQKREKPSNAPLEVEHVCIYSTFPTPYADEC